MAATHIDPLLQPYTLKGLTLRNRVVSTSHEPAYGEDGLPKDRYRLYHLEKARGGVGLTMMGGSAVVSPDSPPSFGNLLLYKDEIVPWLRRLTDDVHDAGAAVMCQVTHLGRRTSNYTDDWLPVVYSSPLREPAHRSFPKQAEDWDIDRIVRHFAEAAQRCEAGGLDGIELMSYGHLLDGFVSPFTNRRDDEFGGSFENRIEFPLRVIRAIKQVTDPGFVLGIRMSLDENREGGLGQEEAVRALKTYAQEGVDFVSTIRGTIESDNTLARVIPSMGTPSAPFIEWTGQIRREVGIPVMHASRVADVATARYAVREGLVDLIGMTRAQIADPHLVRKIASRQEDRIRPCVGANYCLDAIYQSGDAKCVHNPATGREQTLAHEIAPTDGEKLRAVVVGAGPAGLEAARVLGARGHDVVLFEAADHAGGQIRLTQSSPHRRDLIGIVDWRLDEARHHGVDIRLNTYVEADDVLAENPDLVIVATGGVPNTEFLQEGANLVNDVWDVMGGAMRASGDVLVFDDAGGHAVLDAAETLALKGCRVEFVTPERSVAPDVGSMNSPAYLKTFAEKGVVITLPYYLRRVRKSSDGRLEAVLWSEYADLEVTRVVDHVVVDHGTLPMADVYDELKPRSRNGGEVDLDALLRNEPQSAVRNPEGSFRLFRIGDAVSSRNIHAAIYDALRLCQVL
ncbi:MAG: NADH:flavin oxidoreductase [Dermatophilus congolensis]|nr:NADH:flavin oxidoreductase [Dermatophilus congolensis]